MTSAVVQLAHGGGGRLSRKLLQELVLPRFGHAALAGLPDAAALSIDGAAILFTTDSFVVQPLEFPGGNIGHLAVHGTVNDLAVAGAEPRFLSLGMILEEGLPIPLLARVLDSIRDAAAECGVAVVTGDTKVVGRGQCDGLYLNTAGIGVGLTGFALDAAQIREGDAVLASGTLGDHGLAVLAARANLPIENGPVSDTGSVYPLVEAIQDWAPRVRFMRDPTRGGAAAVLNEAVEGRSTGILVRGPDLPFAASVRAVAELLGLDPLHAASEGRVLLFCAPEAAEPILATWRGISGGEQAARIGIVTGDDDGAGRVVMETVTGGRRLVDVPRGELLPRIC